LSSTVGHPRIAARPDLTCSDFLTLHPCFADIFESFILGLTSRQTSCHLDRDPATDDTPPHLGSYSSHSSAPRLFAPTPKPNPRFPRYPRLAWA
jgi:hypothetical protein